MDLEMEIVGDVNDGGSHAVKSGVELSYGFL